MKITSSQRNYIVLIVFVGFASLVYLVLSMHRLEQTALLFVGIPVVLGIAAVFTNPPNTGKGAALRTVTLGLLLAGPLLHEGFVCLLFSMPIFYAVALLVGSVIDSIRNRDEDEPRRYRYFSIALLIPFILEGATPTLSFPREETVSVTRVVLANPSQVEAALAQPPRIIETLPGFLRIGFPRPVEAHGSGINVGDERIIHFAGGEGRPGDLILHVAASEPGRVLFLVKSDRSKIAHWLDWRSSDVTYAAVDASHTRVTWKIGFTRRLDPSWYFRPWERYTVSKAAEYLIESNATPPRKP